MVRFLGIAMLIGVLAACQGEETPEVSQSISTQNAGDSRVAKNLFGNVPNGSAQTPDAIGGYARGCQAGAVQLAETGPTWQAMRLSRNRNWGQPELVDFVQDLSAFAAKQPGWEGLYVGDLSQPRGGPMLTGHASHQIGLDADIWMLPPNRLNLTRQEREDLSSISMPPAGDGCADADRWVRDILNPPPPDPNPNPRPPRGPITMAGLPGQCLGVLNAN